MDSEKSPPSHDPLWLNCDCCCHAGMTLTSWPRSVKRKLEQMTDGQEFKNLSVARVEIENECAALREALVSHQQTIQELYTELDEERNASSSAANEAMSMILRLQREKAEVQMEARQFKRYAEEKMAHDQQELLILEDVLYKREQLIQSLTCEVQAYKHRLLSFGYGDAEAEAAGGSNRGVRNVVENIEAESAGGSNRGETRNMLENNEPESAGGSASGGIHNVVENGETEFNYPSYDYPPLKCCLNETPVSADENEIQFDLEKYAFGETPKTRDHLQNLEYRICQLERNPSGANLDGEFSGTRNYLEKVAIGQSPGRFRHSQRLSHDSSSSFFGMVKEPNPVQDFRTETPRQGSGLRRMDDSTNIEEYPLPKVDNASDFGDDMSDRIYTIDSVQPTVRTYGDYITTPREAFARIDSGEADIKKLYMRLQALEADRESMRQAIISMRTEKAQLVLLKEIAQQLCKGMTPEKRVSMKKPSSIGSFSFMSVVKWVVSFVFWRKKAHRSKYIFELSNNNVGLLLLLDKSPRMRQWRCLSRISQV
ncbi:myosin-binding protein 7 [Aristolochia californica]|uniref:myosin-binding protein 7 n=1 Tax=Aristolochia californica TaxID=171875 RepID=UPI0035DE8348